MSVPVAVGVPGVAPPASITAPVVVPEMTAESLLPVMVIVTSCWGAVDGGHREAVGQVPPALSACTAPLALSSV